MDQSREFNADQRKAAAKSGAARGDGSFPIQNRQDLLNAIRALGRAKNPDAARRHIIKRARALGLTALLPKDWDASALPCEHEGCVRKFLTDAAMAEHVSRVHSHS
jgi:hypothetical protein